LPVRQAKYQLRLFNKLFYTYKKRAVRFLLPPN
jgi:hypothetical protein